MKRHSNTTSYETDGVMRCCIESLERYVTEHPLVEEGEEVLCRWENAPQDSGFVLRGNIWKVRLFDDETKQRLSS